MKVKNGHWYVESGKDTPLYCHGVQDGRVNLSYQADSPIAVCPTLEDFELFWEPAHEPAHKCQPSKTYDEVAVILNSVQFMDRRLRLGVMGKGFFIQVQYQEEDVETGKMALQSARKWYISPFSTESEIVEAAFKACRTSMDHVLKEHFLYKGRRVYSPHFDVNARIEMCDKKKYDARIPLEQ